MERYQSSPNAYYIKEDVEEREYFIQKYVYSLKIRGLNVPKPVHYNKKTKQLVMAKIHGMNISDMYGDDIANVPDKVFQKLRRIMKQLRQHEILYPDFTGYNFILDNNQERIWVIDFGHASFCTEIDDPFVLSICEGEKHWNSEFQ